MYVNGCVWVHPFVSVHLKRKQRKCRERVGGERKIKCQEYFGLIRFPVDGFLIHFSNLFDPQWKSFPLQSFCFLEFLAFSFWHVT